MCAQPAAEPTEVQTIVRTNVRTNVRMSGTTDVQTNVQTNVKAIAPTDRWTWQWLRFHDLALDDLYDALALRCRVFVLEQGPYLDPDGLDRCAWHLLARDASGVLQAYLRLVDPGCKYDEPSIGRVITAPEVRGTGAGWRLMREGLARSAMAWPGQGIRISAQAHLQAFYGALGFEAVGASYLEDDIPHLQMFRGPT
jgi:ElaA protein